MKWIRENEKKICLIIVILLILDLLIISLIGYTKNKDNNFSKKTKGNTWKEVNLTDKQYLNNIAIGLFNDAFKYITFENDNKVRISDDGKIITAAKALYLNNELNTKSKINNDTKKQIENKAKEIFGTNVSYTDFKINLSDDYCGTGGYNSKSGLEKDQSTTSSGKCTLPLAIFKTSEAQKSGDDFVLKVYVAFIDQEAVTSANSCKENEESFGNIISAYTDPEKTQSIYATKAIGCCPKGSCVSAGIKNESDKIKKLAEDNDSYYNLYFEKKAEKNFRLKSIKRD